MPRFIWNNMSKGFKTLIEAIATAFDCSEEKSVMYNQHTIGALSNTQQEKTRLITTLMDIIYRDFYCAIPSSVKKNNTDNKSFYQLLVNASQAEQTISKGWKILEHESSGGTYLQKHNRIIYAEAGNYIFEYDNRYANNSGYTGVVVNPPHNKHDAYFYYVKSIIPGSDSIPIIRFYFNIKNTGAPALIQSVKTHFNKFGVPFVFKCCAKPEYYNRVDTAVLYIDYNLFSIAVQLLQKVVADVKKYLNKQVPVFTYRITDGVSFAENPSGNLSLGQSRCYVIATAIIDGMLAGKNKNDFTDFIIECFKRDGYNLEKIYLNPLSNLSYNFMLGGFKND